MLCTCMCMCIDEDERSRNATAIVRGLIGKLNAVAMKLLVKLFLTIVDIPIITEHDKDS